MQNAITGITIGAIIGAWIWWSAAVFASWHVYGMSIADQLPFQRGWTAFKAKDSDLSYIFKRGARGAMRSPTAIFWLGSDREIEESVAYMLADYLTLTNTKRLPDWVQDDLDRLTLERPTGPTLPAFVIERNLPNPVRT